MVRAWHALDEVAGERESDYFHSPGHLIGSTNGKMKTRERGAGQTNVTLTGSGGIEPMRVCSELDKRAA